MSRILYFFLVFLVSVTGCALSPQVITINPEINIGAGKGGAIVLAIEVADIRNSRVLGQRGGVYNATSDITTEDDITAPLRQNLSGALKKLGYQVVDDRSVPALRVEIAVLGYAVQVDKVTRTIETRAVVNAIYKKGNKTYTNTYSTTRKKEMLTAPTEPENEQLINDTLASVLQQMLEDRELFWLIENNM